MRCQKAGLGPVVNGGQHFDVQARYLQHLPGL